MHLQKNRLRPAAAVFQLAQINLEKYPACHARLNLTIVLELIRDWQRRLAEGEFAVNPLTALNVPALELADDLS